MDNSPASMRTPSQDSMEDMEDNEPVFHEGWVTKRSKWLFIWRRRFAQLSGTQLAFARVKTGIPHIELDLSFYTTVRSAEQSTGKQHAIEIFSTEGYQSFFMYLDSEKEKNEWMDAIGKALMLPKKSKKDSDMWSFIKEGY